MEENNELVFDGNIEELEPFGPIMEVEIKPCYNYQSITVRKQVTGIELDSMLELYKKLLEGLKSVTDEVLNDDDVNFEPATDRQKEIMDHFKIVYPKKCSKEQAQKLIEKSIAKNSK